ncbi:MAG: hypothetical protein HW389_3085 [Bacteroidetes bacterium]|nr:hypothetical protein [Bacteroidota bacterium]
MSSRQNHTTLISGAVLGLNYWVTRPDAFLFPFIDYVSLLCQRDITYSIWRTGDRSKLVFSTCPSRVHKITSLNNSKRLDGIPIPASKYVLSAHSHNGDRNTIDSEGLKEVQKLLHQTVALDQEGGQSFLSSLRSSIRYFEKGSRLRSMANPNGELKRLNGDNRASILIAPMKQILEDALATVRDSAQLRFTAKRLQGAVNLLPFVFVCNEVPRVTHTAIPLPTGEQEKAMDEATARKSFSIDHLQRVFHTGLVHFKDAERPLRTKAQEESFESNKFYGRFYVPLHVEGVPWIVLARISEGRDIWFDNYVVYRDVISRVASQVRQGAKKVYLEQVAMVLRRALLSAENAQEEMALLKQKVNTGWRELTTVYPFAKVEIVGKSSLNSSRLTLPSGQHVWVTTDVNPHYGSHVRYDLLSPDTIVGECERVLSEMHKEKITIERQAHQQFRLRIEGQEHTVFNRLPTAHLELALRREAELTGEARRRVTDALRSVDILDASLRVAFEQEKELKSRLGVSTVLELISWLQERVLSSEPKPVITVDKNIVDVSLNDGRSIADAFTLLWNLWHNAGKMTSPDQTGELRIDVSWSPKGMRVKLTNPHSIEQEWINYMLHDGPYPLPKKTSGLKIVKENLIQLDWSIEAIHTDARSTTIILLIPYSIGRV